MIPLVGSAPLRGAAAPPPTGNTRRSMEYSGTSGGGLFRQGFPGYAAASTQFGWAKYRGTRASTSLIADTDGAFQIYTGTPTDRRMAARSRATNVIESADNVIVVDQWFHFCAIVGTNVDGATDLIFYINGNEIGRNSAGSPTNLSGTHTMFVGEDDYDFGVGPDTTFDGSLADVCMVEGIYLPSQTNFNAGQWTPFAFPASTLGYYLTGEDANNAGKDFSGNANDFTSAGGNAIVLSAVDVPPGMNA